MNASVSCGTEDGHRLMILRSRQRREDQAVAVATIVDYLGVVDLSLAAEHRRGHGALYDGLNSGRLDIGRLRVRLAGLPLPRTANGRRVLAVDVSSWLRPDVHFGGPAVLPRLWAGEGSGPDDFRVAVLVRRRAGVRPHLVDRDPGRGAPRTTDDATAVTADQLRDVVNRLIAAGHWRDGDPEILIVADTGYDITRLAFVLADLPVQLLGRIRTDRVLRLPKPPRAAGATGRQDLPAQMLRRQPPTQVMSGQRQVVRAAGDEVVCHGAR
ncbi:transposase [Micromonospora sp. IBHARD004]|uniref:transposase n=1 Tax=Micromonospora sp. IBHARD004 TaxID=3457764 RepID=UPI00405868A1